MKYIFLAYAFIMGLIMVYCFVAAIAAKLIKE